MMMQVAGMVLTFVSAIGVALIAGIFGRSERRIKADKARSEARAAIRAEENRLSMAMMGASISLGTATAIAIKEGHTNGYMDKALIEADVAKCEYYKFINDLASKNITKE